MKAVQKSDETVSAFDAKTHLSKLLKEVQEGHVITITNRGKPVAKLIPYSDSNNLINKNDLLKQFDEIRQNVKGKINIKSYIAEGRKH